MPEFPVLTNILLNEIVRNIKTDTSKFIGQSFCPIVPLPGDKVEWDVINGESGMTPAVAKYAESPIHKVAVLSHKIFEAASWREKSILTASDLTLLRRPGTWDQSYGQQMITERLAGLNTRLDSRIEWLIWQAIAVGTITIAQTDPAIAFTVDYGIAGALKPTATPYWSVSATATPIANIEAWKILFRGTGCTARKIIMNEKVYGYLLANAEIKSWYMYTYGREMVAGSALGPKLCGLDLQVYDGGYNTDAGVYTPFISDSTVLIQGEGPAGEKVMDFGSPPSAYKGGVLNPQPGKFAKVIMHDDDDPPHADLIVGIDGLPRLWRADRWVIATVATP